MKIHVRLFGREFLAVDVDQAQAPDPTPVAPQAEPEIPAGFGFHGGAGGSQQTTWQPVTDRPMVVDHG